jgi:hypothetical protein
MYFKETVMPKILKNKPYSTARRHGSHLSTQLRRRLRLGGLWLETSHSKKFMRFHLNRKGW